MTDLTINKRPQAISLTPLIDVVFILLMFFMLTSSFIKEKQITLASATTNSAAIAEEPQRLWLTAEGVLSDENGKTMTDLSLQALDNQRPIILHPAESANVQTIVTALTHTKQLGLDNLTLSAPYQTDAIQTAPITTRQF